MAAPRISICVPLYNKVQSVEHCLKTVLASPPDCMELVLFDNGSTDGSSEIAARIAAEDARVRHVRLEHTIMIQESWRMAFLHARGEILKLQSADDELHPEFWSKMLPPLDNPDIDFTLCAEAVEVQGTPSVDLPRIRRTFDRINGICKKLIATADPVARARELMLASTDNKLGNIYKVVLRRSCLPLERWRAVTPAYPMPTSYPDWDFLLRLLLSHRGHYVDQTLSLYRITAEAPIARLTSDAALSLADSHQLLLMLVTALADPTLHKMRAAISASELQSLQREAVHRLTHLFTMAGALPKK